MSDEQRKDEESEVEVHRRKTAANDEPSDEAETDDEVEAHRRKTAANDEPNDEAETDDEVEAHRMRKTNSRLD
jgi:hypothetical protein